MSLTLGQILKVCRVCESTENLLDISTVKYSHLNEKLHQVAEFKHEYSCYFRFICVTCSLQLENSFDFKTQCENTFTQLINQLELHKETLSKNFNDNACDADSQSDGIVDEFNEANETKYSDLFEMIDSSEVLDHEKIPEELMESLQEYYDANESGRCKQTKVQPVKSDRIYTCAFCGIDFKDRYSVIGHIEGKHLKVFRFKCGLCDKKFAYSTQMCRHRKSHMKSYLPEAPPEIFSCGLCGKKLKTKMILKKHIKMVHLKLRNLLHKRILCDLCGQRSVCMATHKQHMNTHKDDRPYKCEHCDKTFKQKQGLAAHIKTHIDERTYKCTLCPKAFRTPRYLKNHMKVHNDVRDHECRSCGKAFRNISSLRMHLRLHTGETPYECKHCSKKFSQTRLLGNHMKVCSAISKDSSDERSEM